jgi:hypothetical protein
MDGAGDPFGNNPSTSYPVGATGWPPIGSPNLQKTALNSGEKQFPAMFF